MSAGVGGLILIVQFLIEFESRLSSAEVTQRQSLALMGDTIDRGFANLNYATQLVVGVEQAGVRTAAMAELVQRAAELGADTPPVVAAFVQTEIARMSSLLRGVGEREVTYDGEDRDMLLSLTDAVSRSIDAISLSNVDAGGKAYDAGFWGTDLGYRYLEAQREAVMRKVRVRRIFILQEERLTGDGEFTAMCRRQTHVGVDIRVLFPQDIPTTMKFYLWDFILFDDSVSYEVTPAVQFDSSANPVIVHTRLVMRDLKVKQRIERYRELWDRAMPFD
jgi:hypothetical protein